MSKVEKVFGVEPKNVVMDGYWTVYLHRGDELVQKVEGHNVVTTAGKEFLASFLYSSVVSGITFPMKFVAIGTDATAEAIGNTALGTEVARTTGTVSYVTGAIYQVTASFGSGVGTGAIVEYGLLSANAGGTLLSRDTEAVINKGANDSLTTVVRITVG